MKILAIETSGETFSIALNEDGKTVACIYYNCGRIHSEAVIPAIEKLIKDTKNTLYAIDKFAVSTGPGSFTGVRIGITVTKTFAQALDKPIAAIDTLTILEKSFVVEKGIKIIPAIDALRNEVYIKDNSSKTGIGIKNINDFIVDLQKYKNRVSIIGNAAIIYKEKLSKGLGVNGVFLPYIMHTPKASTLAEMAYYSIKDTHYSKVNPLYIRRSWAEEIKTN
jgi:tRNA threonylcarbamoyladenosine biosynthesis protein TsaB